VNRCTAVLRNDSHLQKSIHASSLMKLPNNAAISKMPTFSAGVGQDVEISIVYS
jgi:hypothetical protein